MYSPEVQDALTAAAMVGNKQVSLMKGPSTSLVLDMKQMVQRNSKGVEKRVRGLVGSGDKLSNWEVNEGKERTGIPCRLVNWPGQAEADGGHQHQCGGEEVQV